MKIVKHTRYRVRDHAYLWKKGDINSIALISIVPCCDTMNSALDEDYIGFGEYDSMLNNDANINIYHCSPYPEGAVWDVMPIIYCPFCATKIEITEQEKSK